MQYDDDGNPLTTNLIDYAIPSAAELCSFEVSNTQTDSPRNPLGAKGIGESGTIGSTPAIHNAVVDALSHLGVTHIDMPCTPERVWRAIQDAARCGPHPVSAPGPDGLTDCPWCGAEAGCGHWRRGIQLLTGDSLSQLVLPRPTGAPGQHARGPSMVPMGRAGTARLTGVWPRP